MSVRHNTSYLQMTIDFNPVIVENALNPVSCPCFVAVGLQTACKSNSQARLCPASNNTDFSRMGEWSCKIRPPLSNHRNVKSYLHWALKHFQWLFYQGIWFCITMNGNRVDLKHPLLCFANPKCKYPFLF